jgi:hypothetical protein
MASKERIKRKVKRDLHRARDPEVAREILAEVLPEVETKAQEKAEGRVPGRIVGGSKTGYTYSDLVKMFPIVTFTPLETLPLNFQGVRVQALSGVEMHVPSVYKEIYDRYMLGKTRNSKPEGIEGWFAPGAGALE